MLEKYLSSIPLLCPILVIYGRSDSIAVIFTYLHCLCSLVTNHSCAQHGMNEWKTREGENALLCVNTLHWISNAQTYESMLYKKHDTITWLQAQQSIMSCVWRERTSVHIHSVLFFHQIYSIIGVLYSTDDCSAPAMALFKFFQVRQPCLVAGCLPPVSLLLVSSWC